VLAVRRVRPAADIIDDFIEAGREACGRDAGPDADGALDED
jgi:hypothetical protein